MLWLLFPLLPLAVILFYAYDLFYWKRRGIPGPIGSLFIGNLWQIGSTEYPGSFWLKDWTKKYGKVYGINEGYRKVLVVSDVDMLQELFINKFDYFYGRKTNPIAGDVENDARVHLFESRGNRWKRLRTICAPTFSSNSLKKISAIVEDSALELSNLFNDVKETEPINLHTYYQEYTMDVISRIALGQGESKLFKNHLSSQIKKIFGFDRQAPVFLFTAAFPCFRIQLKKFFSAMAKSTPITPIYDACYKALDERIAQREKDAAEGFELGEPNDFIDLFLDARAEGHLDEDAEFNKNNVKVSKALTREEIVAQCFVFLLAGFDTTSNALAYTSWLLTTNPDKQKKLLAEIDEHCPSTGPISYDILAKLKYMEACIKETLRMFPIAANAASRRCMKSTTLGDVEIEEGTYIWADVWTIQYDKKLWGEDAKDFVPERWLNDEIRHNMAWLPFGAGPRVCIGQRLAYVEEKYALIYLLRRFTMERGLKTETKLKLSGAATVSPDATTVYLKQR